MILIRLCVRFINSIIVIYTIDTCSNLLNQIDFAVDRRSGATLGKFSMSKQLAADVLVGEPLRLYLISFYKKKKKTKQLADLKLKLQLTVQFFKKI